MAFWYIFGPLLGIYALMQNVIVIVIVIVKEVFFNIFEIVLISRDYDQFLLTCSRIDYWFFFHLYILMYLYSCLNDASVYLQFVYHKRIYKPSNDNVDF